MQKFFNKLRRLFMPHLYELNPKLKGKKPIAKTKPKEEPPKKRGRPKKAK
tara:strand:+ start:631 stop:780 length:150 start_codon:yes stop_codon:yes gene_type:complete